MPIDSVSRGRPSRRTIWCTNMIASPMTSAIGTSRRYGSSVVAAATAGASTPVTPIASEEPNRLDEPSRAGQPQATTMPAQASPAASSTGSASTASTSRAASTMVAATATGRRTVARAGSTGSLRTASRRARRSARVSGASAAAAARVGAASTGVDSTGVASTGRAPSPGSRRSAGRPRAASSHHPPAKGGSTSTTAPAGTGSSPVLARPPTSTEQTGSTRREARVRGEQAVDEVVDGRHGRAPAPRRRRRRPGARPVADGDRLSDAVDIRSLISMTAYPDRRWPTCCC